jgi:hypothetical protein
MRILRVRHGFQADHSSSSYLFYAVDHDVSAEGQAVAHRYSSRAEVDDRTVRYLKWGESSLSSDAYEALAATFVAPTATPRAAPGRSPGRAPRSAAGSSKHLRPGGCSR